MNHAITNGYTESFKVTTRGLYAISKGRYYRPEQVQITDYHRFESQANPDDNANMYVIEASDGLRGTLIDVYGTYSDAILNKFITAVEDIRKKLERFNRHEC